MKTPVPSDIYDKEYYEKYNHGYDTYKDQGDLMPELKRKFENVSFENKKVLDIGCGRGEFIVYAVTKNASEAVGIDYSQASVDISNEFVASKTHGTKTKTQILKMDAKELNFPDGYFDYVVMLDIVEHLHDWELKKCLAEVKRVLKSDGTIFIHTSPNKFMMAPVRFMAHLVGVQLKSQEFHVNEQTYFSLKSYLTKDFEGQLLLEKDVHYWYNQMGFRSRIVKIIATLLDSVIDTKLIHSLMAHYPLSIIFCTDLWFIGKKTGK